MPLLSFYYPIYPLLFSCLSNFMKKIFLKAEFLKLLLYFPPLIAKPRSDFIGFIWSYSVGTYRIKSLIIFINVDLFLIFSLFLFHLPCPLGLFLKYFSLIHCFKFFCLVPFHPCYFIPYFYPSICNIWSPSLSSELSTFYFRQLLFSYLFLTSTWQTLPWPFNAPFSWRLTMAALTPNHHMWERFKQG